MIVLKDILYNDLLALIEFIYMGEVRVKHNDLPSFLRTAEVLRVRGLTESSSKFKKSQLTSCNSSTNPNIPSHLCQSLSNSIPENDLTTTQVSSKLATDILISLSLCGLNTFTLFDCSRRALLFFRPVLTTQDLILLGIWRT